MNMKGVKDKFNNFKNKILNELFPENFTCNCCGAEIATANKYGLCENCVLEIKPIKFPCKICGDELNSFTNVCDNCKNRKRYFDYAISTATYDGVAKKIVHNLKYNNCAYLAKTIGAFLADTFYSGKFDLIDIVICVPLSKEKRKVRGYNQAEEILKEFVSYYGFDYNLDCLVRTKNTTTQTALTRKERHENLVNAFKLMDESMFIGKNVLVIDDVLTTGSTLDEIAKLLKENGASKVFGLTFCHTKITNYEK